eukprot:GHVT01100601.1.p1 GENE.GHVT01100601.1~~GHVT01100601.1.p1  ORF type:complete len:603 (+),score=138.60 GHVT01100601.1:597-2405(+)
MAASHVSERARRETASREERGWAASGQWHAGACPDFCQPGGLTGVSSLRTVSSVSAPSPRLRSQPGPSDFEAAANSSAPASCGQPSAVPRNSTPTARNVPQVHADGAHALPAKKNPLNSSTLRPDAMMSSRAAYSSAAASSSSTPAFACQRFLAALNVFDALGLGRVSSRFPLLPAACRCYCAACALPPSGPDVTSPPASSPPPSSSRGSPNVVCTAPTSPAESSVAAKPRSLVPAPPRPQYAPVLRGSTGSLGSSRGAIPVTAAAMCHSEPSTRARSSCSSSSPSTPAGWCRFGLDLSSSAEHTNAAAANWPVAYHGTLSSNVASIVDCGSLRVPDSKTVLIRKGHIANQFCIFVSPSPIYAGYGLYASPFQLHANDTGGWQVMMEVRMRPGSFVKRPETSGLAAYPADPTGTPNEELEWKTELNDAVLVTAVLIRRVSNQQPKWHGQLAAGLFFRHYEPLNLNAGQHAKPTVADAAGQGLGTKQKTLKTRAGTRTPADALDAHTQAAASSGKDLFKPTCCGLECATFLCCFFFLGIFFIFFLCSSLLCFISFGFFPLFFLFFFSVSFFNGIFLFFVCFCRVGFFFFLSFPALVESLGLCA